MILDAVRNTPCIFQHFGLSVSCCLIFSEIFMLGIYDTEHGLNGQGNSQYFTFSKNHRVPPQFPEMTPCFSMLSHVLYTPRAFGSCISGYAPDCSDAVCLVLIRTSRVCTVFLSPLSRFRESYLLGSDASLYGVKKETSASCLELPVVPFRDSF